MKPLPRLALYFALAMLIAIPAAVLAADDDDDSAVASDMEEEVESDMEADVDEAGEADADETIQDDVNPWEVDGTLTLEEMSVTALRSATSVRRTPRNVSVVTKSEITEQLLRTTPEALRFETGVSVQRTNLGGGSPFVRGLTGNQILTLVDGIRLNNSTFRGGPNQYLNTIDPLFVDRIEIVRGIGSVLYGSDALGGVIHVITKRRWDKMDAGFGISGSALVRATTAEQEETGHVYLDFNVTKHFGFAGAYTYRDFGGLDAGGGVDFDNEYAYTQQDFGGNLDLRIDAHHGFQFGYQNSNAFDVPGYAPDDLLSEFDPQRRDLFYGKYIGTDIVAGLESVEATVSVNHQYEGRNEVKASTPELRKRDRDAVITYHGGLKLESQIGRWARFTYGAEYYRDEISSKRQIHNAATGEVVGPVPQLPDDAVFESAAGYLQVQVVPVKWLTIIPGARYSWFKTDADLAAGGLGDLDFDSETSDITWSGHLLFDINDDHQITAGVARGFRVPSLNDWAKFGTEDGRLDIPNDDLDPESAVSYELGYRGGWDRYVRASVFGYYTQLDDLIQRKPATFLGSSTFDGNPVFTNENVGEAHIWGVEGDLTLSLPPNWTLFANVAYTFGENETDDEPIRRIPPLHGALYLRYTADDESFFLQPYLFWAGNQERLSSGDKSDSRIPDGGTDTWVTYNIMLGFRSEYVSVSLIAENLADEKYKVHGSGVYEAGRNFKGQLEFHFGL